MHREPAFAGTFYPRERERLLEFMKSLCPELKTERARAIMVPHAGYVYSGKTAGAAYARVEIPETVVVLGPNHTGVGPPVSIWYRGNWHTPLGNVPIDEKLAERILEDIGSPDFLAHEREHSIEVHLPFLQYRQPRLRIVPIVLGRLSITDCRALAETLVGVAPHALWVASTDMSHFISRAEAREKDSLALDAVKALDGPRLYDVVRKNNITMCGFIPTTVVVDGCRTSGATEAKIVAYTDSGEVTGDRESVVAYAAAVIPDTKASEIR